MNSLIRGRNATYHFTPLSQTQTGGFSLAIMLQSDKDFETVLLMGFNYHSRNILKSLCSMNKVLF